MSVTINAGTGFDEDAQAGSFMNATLQSAGDAVTFSVATLVEVPEAVYALGIEAVSDFLVGTLEKAVYECPTLRFQVQVGPAINP